jgi:hypothetical protein
VFILWLHFLALYLITGAVIRLFTLKFPDSRISDALMFAH